MEASMSTMGREADEAAKRKREYERRLAGEVFTLQRALDFAIATLEDRDLSSDIARATALQALKPWRSL
jgi:hypothetical protein